MSSKHPAPGSLHRILDLGRGGMGRVWLAAHRGSAGLTKLLVVKQLRNEFTGDAHFRSMFLEEARLAAKLNHPNVVQTLEVREQGQALFLIMEYLEGQSLYSLYARRRPPPDFSLAILTSVCAGLHHAHELADYDGTPLCMVHRDVCPQNVIVTYAGQVKVVDFGIAKANTQTQSAERPSLRGRVGYLSPEQAAQAPLDRRADVFSVGVMLWEALAGKRLWHGVPEAGIAHHLTRGVIPDIALVAPSAPAELVRICRKAMQRDPAARYQTALELQADLENQLRRSGRQVTARELASLMCSIFEDERRRTRAVVTEKFGALGLDLTGVASGARSTLPPAVGFRRTVSGAITKPPAPPARQARASAQNRPDLLPDQSAGRAMGAPSRARLSEPRRRSTSESPAWVLPPPYQIDCPLGAGTNLYLGRNAALGHRVVMQITRGLKSPGELQAALRGAAELRHPSAVALLDAGLITTPVPAAYVVREHVDGQPLANLFAERPGQGLGIDRTVHFAIQLLWLLSEAHVRGLVHSRLDPGHLLATSLAGAPDLLKVLGFWPSFTAQPSPESTGYLAPEQRDGETPTPGSNLYSVGALLYQGCFGRPPPPFSSSMPPRIPDTGVVATDPRYPALRDTLCRALAPDSAARYQTALDMLEAVQSLLSADSSERPRVGMDVAALVGAAPDHSRCEILPVSHLLMAASLPRIWLLEDDPAMTHGITRQAAAHLGERYEVRALGRADRELAVAELRSGRTTPPWVIVFGDLHVLLEDELLEYLSSSAEMSRMLISTHQNLELLQTSINNAGLDYHVTLPTTPKAIEEGVDLLVQRTQTLFRHYDGIRMALHDAHDEVGELSRALTEDAAGVPSTAAPRFGWGVDLR